VKSHLQPPLPPQVKWSRAARTDKGVSAVSQVVAAKVFGDEPLEELPATINRQLPDQVRVLGVTRVTEGFNARTYCSKRRYEYVLPAWVFDPRVGKGRSAADRLEGRAQSQAARGQQQQQQPGGADNDDDGEDDDEGAEGGGGGGEEKEQRQPAAGGGGGRAAAGAAPADGGNRKQRRMRAEVAASSYEFTEAERQRMNVLLAQYVGTHNYHNYTVRCTEPSGPPPSPTWVARSTLHARAAQPTPSPPQPPPLPPPPRSRLTPTPPRRSATSCHSSAPAPSRSAASPGCGWWCWGRASCCTRSGRWCARLQ
jgi:tRNA U38,U39,U40 pseudouridine synthase TruA